MSDHPAGIIERSAAAAWSASRDPTIRDLALALTNRRAPNDQHGQATDLFRWVQTRIRYAYDPQGTEFIQTAPYTLERRSGDCVAQSVLLIGLLRARGIDAELLFVDPDGQGIAHALVYVDPTDAPPFLLDPIDYEHAAGYVGGGTLLLVRGFPGQLSVEQVGATEMLGLTTRNVGRLAVGASHNFAAANYSRMVGSHGWASSNYTMAVGALSVGGAVTAGTFTPS